MGAPYEGDSTIQSVAGIKGTNTAGGDAVVGQATGGGRGVAGVSDTQAGVVGTSAKFVGVWGESQSPANAGQPGVFGKSPNWQGVHGESTSQVGVFGISTNFVGVWGESQSPANAGHPGVFGKSPNGQGVYGESTSQVGVFGISTNFVGVWGESRSPANAGHPGVFGKSPNGQGVYGESTSQVGAFGISTNFVGVWGESQSPADAGQPGVFGKSPNGQGVHGESTSQVGVFGISTNFVGVWGESQSPDQPGLLGKGPSLAGRFEGDVEVTGDIKLLAPGQDCAEEFDLADSSLATPGTVMITGESGALEVCWQPYDGRVVGVISGAGQCKPAIVLGKQQPSNTERATIALMGRVYCKVDATAHPICVGDLLTTSATPGHAMKAADSARAFGAVIGKALRTMAHGKGEIPILVALQ